MTGTKKLETTIVRKGKTVSELPLFRSGSASCLRWNTAAKKKEYNDLKMKGKIYNKIFIQLFLSQVTVGTAKPAHSYRLTRLCLISQGMIHILFITVEVSL